MSSMTTYAAEIIRASESALAAFAANALIEQRPDVKRRFGSRAFGAWKSEIEGYLTNLVASLEAGDPGVFASQIGWLRDAFVVRGGDVDDLRAALACLREVLREELPETAFAEVDPPMREGIDAALARAAAPSTEEATDSTICSTYLLKLLEGDRRAAMDVVQDAIERQKLTIPEVYLDVLIPAVCRIGRMWHAGEVNVAEEHFATSTTQMLMAVLCRHAERAPANGRVAVIAGVTGDAHEIGLRAAADLLEMAGWRVIFLGADMPPGDLSAGVEAFDADLVVLGASLPPHLNAAQRTIAAIRNTRDDVPILVGGGAFGGDRTLAERIGADDFAPSLQELTGVAAKLVGLGG